ncbi:hypothetical protein J4Q44_G00097580 [Coregonus suidteri]|uniref:Uncharacterized protein n=1 Tax=Coregonus suidteri TaxID=861788 RepID=A0AAN8M9F4_9TELE
MATAKHRRIPKLTYHNGVENRAKHNVAYINLHNSYNLNCCPSAYTTNHKFYNLNCFPGSYYYIKPHNSYNLNCFPGSYYYINNHNSSNHTDHSLISLFSTSTPATLITSSIPTADLTTFAHAVVKLSSYENLDNDGIVSNIEEFLKQIGSNALGPLKITVKHVTKCSGAQCGDQQQPSTSPEPSTLTQQQPSTSPEPSTLTQQQPSSSPEPSTLTSNNPPLALNPAHSPHPAPPLQSPIQFHNHD